MLDEFNPETYRLATPWPNLIIDGLFDPELVAAAESQEMATALELLEHRSYRQVKAESSQVAGPAAAEILDHLTSEEFVNSFRLMTGILDLEADREFFWGGIHVARNGAFQAIHRDFRTHPENGLFHRAVALLYLNSDWNRDFGGELELWTPDARRCEKRVLPSAGRLVVLEMSSRAIHGVPDAVCCPVDRARLTLVAHYYSATPAPHDRRFPIFRRPRRPQDPFRMGFAAPSDALTNIRRAGRTAAGRFASLLP